MKNKINLAATTYVRELPRIGSVLEEYSSTGQTLLLPDNIEINIDEESNAVLSGLDNFLDSKAKDMLKIIEIQNAEEVIYTETEIIAPSLYVHSLKKKPWHVTTQCFLVSYISQETKKWLFTENENMKKYYGKHDMDSFWLPCSKQICAITSQEPICIFNRRISGWDGSIERPVIELLGAGGHLQAIWNGDKFVSRELKENLRKEFSEEMGVTINDDNIICVGGFTNESTQELVVLFCAFLDDRLLPQMHQYALGNLKEDIDGIYLGSFMETICYYKKDPTYFAGGLVASSTNFPNNDKIMQRIYALLNLS